MAGGVSIGWLLFALAMVFLVLGWCGFALFHAQPTAGASIWKDILGRVSALRLRRPALFALQVEDLSEPVRRHRWVFAACGMALATVGGTLALSSRIQLDPLGALQFAHASHIRLRLAQEPLVPPPPLPPSLFVGTGRTGLETADRDWSKLHGDFRQLVLHLVGRMEARGYPMALLEGYRSPEQQEVLARQGEHVTQARAWESKHQYGLAADLAPIKNGRLMISERDPWAFEAYQVLGQEAQAAGLVWGGAWAMKDYGHVEAPGTIVANLGRDPAESK